jgi:hypothetical protein
MQVLPFLKGCSLQPLVGMGGCCRALDMSACWQVIAKRPWTDVFDIFLLEYDLGHYRRYRSAFRDRGVPWADE